MPQLGHIRSLNSAPSIKLKPDKTEEIDDTGSAWFARVDTCGFC
jgi:hypothetical protein